MMNCEANIYSKAYTEGSDPFGPSLPPDLRYRDVDIEKAELSAWLSVQNPLGEPYGTAIKTRILQPSSPIAAKFVNWFKNVYSL